MIPRQVRARVQYDNKDISSDLAPYLKSISYTDNMSGEADDFSMVLEDRKGLWRADWMPEKGAVLHVSLLSRGWGSLLEGEKTLALGSFAIDEIECSAPPSEVSIKGTSIPENNELRGVEKSRSWEKAELKTIAKDIAEGAGLTLVYDTEENPLLDRAEQTEESDLSFLMKLCTDQGLALKVYDKKVVIFDEVKYEEAAPAITIVRPSTIYARAENMLYVTDMTGWRFQSKVREVYKACHVEYQDGETKEVIEATFTDPSKKEGKTLQVKEQVASIAEAERLAKKRLREKNKEEVTGSFDLVGRFEMLASVVVKVLGFGVFDGNYIITSAAHSLGSGYTTSIDVRRCLVGY